ncbi:hypothetical protein BYT27DRAFT_7227077 [Phlegmacium glaucopus]|nr:hypothetical protein BYT27DRAFT_7227077 [Phlegmacium glaucopus]
MRKGHLYYPFTLRDEWELASFLLCSRLSMAAVDHFLKLKLVKNIGLSFHTTKDLRNRAEMLPVGPSWKSKPWPTAFPTKQKLFLYYRDPIDCLQSILHNPLVQDYIQFHSFQLFWSVEGAIRVYTEWLSGNAAWEMQDSLPRGATLLGTVLSSDKTNISAMTGNCMAHPLLISLANLKMNFRMKSSNHAFLLLALLPRLHGLLGDRLVHECLDFILQPLKTTASIGIMMSDPLGWQPLHHWHKAFWDHNAKWCINTVGAAELDFCISSLKQVTGCEHREIQHYIVAVIADAVPPDFLVAIQSLMDFRYLAQSMQIDEPMCAKIDAALKEFHTHKDSIIAAGARRGKNHVIDNWYIPKLEFLQSVVPSICANGIALQWSADGTERAHIEVIKDPSDFSNNQKFESQICRHLDRIEKCQRFDLFTAVRDAKVDFCARFSTNGSSEEDNSDCASVASDDSTIETTANLVNQINPKNPPSGRVPQAQPHTFSSPQAAFHLNRDPSFNKPINDIATLFNIPDLHEALSDYIQCIANANDGYIRVLGGRRSASQGSQLPFTHLQVWKKLHLQNKAYHFPHETLPSKTVNACPPSGEWELGRYNPVIVNLDPDFEWPHSRLEGHQVAELCLIFCIIQHTRSLFHGDCFLTYARRFDIVPQINKNISGSSTAQGPYPEAKSSLYILKRARRANGELIGDILPLQQVSAPVDLTPCFGNVADHRLTKYNSSTYRSEFRLNKYFDKELYLSLS